jgi:hypothetical protein
MPASPTALAGDPPARETIARGAPQKATKRLAILESPDPAGAVVCYVRGPVLNERLLG